MEKFENIKLGDIVFVKKNITYGWGRSESFTVPEKVIKVTKTQFTTESGERYKKDGRVFGSGKYGSCYYEGEKTSHFGNNLAVDQTKEMKQFELKVKLANEVNSLIEKTRITIEAENSDLIELKSILERINK